MTIKPEGAIGADLLHAGSGDRSGCPGQYLLKTLSFGRFAPKELCQLVSGSYYSKHYSGDIGVGSRLQVFHSGRSTAHCGKKMSDGSDRRGCTGLFGGSIYMAGEILVTQRIIL